VVVHSLWTLLRFATGVILEGAQRDMALKDAPDNRGRVQYIPSGKNDRSFNPTRVQHDIPIAP
jgi:hypothetical protein